MDDDIHYIFLGYVVDTKSIRSENESNYNMHKQIKHTHTHTFEFTLIIG